MMKILRNKRVDADISGTDLADGLDPAAMPPFAFARDRRIDERRSDGLTDRAFDEGQPFIACK
jgi:hypothetical protein